MASQPFNRRTVQFDGRLFTERARGRHASGIFTDPALSGGVGQGGTSPDAAKIEASYIGFGTTLNNRFNAADTDWRQLATVIDSDNLINREMWLDSVPQMRMWEGDKVMNQLRGEALQITTRPHEASCIIKKRDIINDQWGLYENKINQMGDAYDWHLIEMVIAGLVAGMQGVVFGTSYDGQNLIDTDHTFLGNGQGVQQSNKVTGAFSATTFQQAWNAYLGFQNEYGKPINVQKNRQMLLVHGPANRTAVRTVLEQDVIVSSLQQNLDKGTARSVLVPWIKPGTYNVLGQTVTLTGLEWFLMPVNSAAIILQRKRGIEFLAVEDGEFAFRTGNYLYGIESEDGFAYGLWQEVVGGPGV